jgi:hypothetical protein
VWQAGRSELSAKEGADDTVHGSPATRRRRRTAGPDLATPRPVRPRVARSDGRGHRLRRRPPHPRARAPAPADAPERPCQAHGGIASTYWPRSLRRCLSSRTMTCSKHSRRILPIRRSANGFCHGLRGAVSTASMPRFSTRTLNAGPHMASRSRSRNRGAASQGNASTTCWAVHSAVGCAVTAKCTIRRRQCAIRKNTNRTVLQEGAPGRRRRLLRPNHVLLHRRLGDVDAELGEFPDDAWGAPPRVRGRHRADESRTPLAAAGLPDLLWERRTQWSRNRRDHRTRLDEDNDVPPAVPGTGQPRPEKTIGNLDARSRGAPLVDGELVAQLHRGA